MGIIRSPEQQFVVERNEKGERREKIDEHIRRYASVLATLDGTVSKLRLYEEGRIERGLSSVLLSDDEKRLLHPLLDIVKEKVPDAQRAVDEYRGFHHVIDAAYMLGALVVIYDSSVGIPSVVESYGVGKISRGRYAEMAHPALGFVSVDICADRRKDGVLPTITLVHEFHHHVRAMIDMALALDPKMPMSTGSFRQSHIGIVEEKVGVLHRSNWDRVHADRSVYEVLLGRDLPFSGDTWALYAETDNIRKQRAYLDELHSSYLQGKQEWFLAGTQVYSFEGKGRYDQIVGNSFADQEAAHDLLSYVQGIYFAKSMYAAGAVLSDADREKVFTSRPEAREFYESFPGVFVRIGACIGVSRTIAQATRLVGEEWRALQRNALVQKGLFPYFEYLAKTPKFLATPSNGVSLMEFLLSPR
jgi:hypothetical protein